MAKKGKLLPALDAHRGRDYRLERQKKQQKQAEKRKSSQHKGQRSHLLETKAAELNGLVEVHSTEKHRRQSSESEDSAKVVNIDSSRGDDSEGDSDAEHDAIGGLSSAPTTANGKSPTSSHVPPSESENDEDIPLSDVDSLPSQDKADIVPHQRLTINNTTALLRARKSISAASTSSFSEYQTVTSSMATSIPDVNDDLTRELAFYKQCLDSANEARALLKKEGMPFSRPNDYFAEMVKSDEHMGKIKQKMTDEAANKKAAVEARRQRDLKKFGKQVQVAKLQERDKAKREMLGKIELLKKKRKSADTGTTNEEGLFDVALEDASKEDRTPKFVGRSNQGPPTKRQKRDEKYGFGGKKRFAKSGDALSSGDLRGFSTKKMKAQKKPQRLGKSRRSRV